MKVPAVDDLSRNNRPLIDVALVAVVQLGVGADLGGAEQGSYGLGAVGALVVLSIESIVTYNLEKHQNDPLSRANLTQIYLANAMLANTLCRWGKTKEKELTLKL